MTSRVIRISWVARFRCATGQTLINQVEVWGVLPQEFREIDANSDRDLWMPTETWAAVGNATELTAASKQFRWFNLIGRLAPGANAAQANDQVSTIAVALAADDPASNQGRGARAVSDFRYRLQSAGSIGLVLFAIVGGVVLLCTVNVAHLASGTGIEPNRRSGAASFTGCYAFGCGAATAD